MTSGLVETPAYRRTIDRLEAVKRLTNQGLEYWHARDIHSILGYLVWDKFVPVVEKARESLAASGSESSHHIAQASKMMGLGKGGQREVEDFYLTRLACYLIAMNGDASKPEIAAAQAYFAIQTRRAELQDRSNKDHHRLRMRHRVTASIKKIGEVAKDAGVQRFGLFAAARLRGLYGRNTVAEIKEVKGVPEGEELLNVIGSFELALHEVQIGMARQKLLDDEVRGEDAAIAVNKRVAESVRQNVIDNLGYGPERLPCEEPIKVVEKRLKAEATPKRISPPTA